MFVHFFTNDKVYFLRKFNLVRTEIWNNGLFQKKIGGGGGGWGYRISSSIEEIAKGIFRGKLKTTWNFQGWSWKNHVEFSEVMVLGLKISEKCNTINFVDFLAWSFVDKFINMRQCWGHWKNWEKQFVVTKWSIFQWGIWNFQETAL